MNPKVKQILKQERQMRIDAKLATIRAENESRGLRFDDAALNISLEQLEHLETTVQETLYQKLQSQNFIPFASRYSDAIDAITYQKITHVGQAKLAHDESEDGPDVSFGEEKYSRNVYPIRAHYHYSLQSERAASLLKFDEAAEKAKASAAAIARKHDRLAAIGEAGTSMSEGFLNSSAVSLVTPDTGNWLNPATTAEQIIADISKATRTILDGTEDNFEANTLLLDVATYETLRLKKIDNPSMPLINYIEANFNLKVEKWNFLKDKNAGGNGPRAVFYHKSPEILEYAAVRVYSELPPERQGFVWKVHSEGRSGGTVIYQPRAIVYMDGL